MNREERLERAFEALRDQRFGESRTLLEQMVSEELADAVVFETLGDVREKLGDDDGAVEAWHMAVDLYISKNQEKRARAVLELLLILRPDDDEARLRLSAIDR